MIIVEIDTEDLVVIGEGGVHTRCLDVPT